MIVHVASAVATKEATDEDSSKLPEQSANDAAVAIRKQAEPANGYRKAKAPLARRCRCGYCFDAEGQELVVSGPELAALKADPMLVVTEIAAPEAARTSDGDTAAPEEPGNAAPEGDTPEGEDGPEGDMPDGEAHA